MKKVQLQCISILLVLLMLCTPLSVFAEVSWTQLPSTPYKAENETPESGDILVIFERDFESDTPGKAVLKNKQTGFSNTMVTSTSRSYVEKDADGNQVMKMYHGDPENVPDPKPTRAERTIPTTNLTNLTIEYDVKASGGKGTQNVSFVDTTGSPTYGSFKPPYKFEDWTHIKIRYDMKKKLATVYVAGREYSTAEFDYGDAHQINVRFSGTVYPDGSWIMIDNIKLSTTDKEIGGMLGLDGTKVNWDYVKLADKDKTGLMDIIRTEHPRIFVNDWQPILDKIATDENAKLWYDTLINAANAQMGTALVEYSRNSRGNINECSTAFKSSAFNLAAAYCLTKDTRYKDRLWQELENVGNWPDWGSDAYLCTAHILLGFAVSYDWLYNEWTPEERQKITAWILEKGMNEAVRSYEGQISGFNPNTSKNNWNNVCNGSNLIAAIAIAQDYPDVADYIFRKAADGLPSSFHEISADGAYAEPLGYWDYGVRHQVKVMSALDTCIKEGTTLPACLDFKDVRGLNNTGDFPIYYNGTTAAFNYGDGQRDIVTTPILFYLANKYEKPQYAWYYLFMEENCENLPVLSGKDAIFSLLWYDPDNASTPEGGFALDKFYKSNEPMGTNGISMRSSWEDDDALVVMMHAGDEDMSHTNLDAGGFILDWAGKRWVHMYGREPGGENAGVVYGWPGYSTRTETGRYIYYHTRGEANNTIIANPQQDKPDMNIEYFAELDSFASGENTAYGIIDMTQTNLDYESAKRGMMLTGSRDTVIIQDEIKAKMPSEYYWFVNTKAEITLSEDGKSALWEYDGDRMLVRITDGPADARFNIMSTVPLSTSPNPDVQTKINEHKMYIHITNAQTLNLTVEFTPLREGEGIPDAQPVKPLSQWNTEGSARTTAQTLGDVVALMVDNPNAYAKGTKTYVDTNNLEIQPIVQNGRTLVPVRFISEKFGATVGWEDATQTVTVQAKTTTIKLQIGSDQMDINGKAITLDVPAQTIGGRTLIPLRALVEALGKEVFWDDRGLILITDTPVDYDADKINKIIDLLDIRVQADGKEIKFFDSEVYEYTVEIAKGAATPTISVLSDKAATVVQGNPSSVNLDGKTYTFRFVENPFEGILGTGSEGVVRYLEANVAADGALPDYQSYVSIKGVTSTIEFSNDKYPENGTFDGIISGATQNRWSANGAGNWICYDLGEAKNLHSIAIAGYMALSRSYIYEIAVSNDGVNFTPVIANAETTNGIDHDVFPLGDISARYVKITGLSASNSTWMGISEVRIYESAQMEADDQKAWNLFFYSDSLSALPGQSVQLTVSGKSTNGTPLPVDISDVVFTSADTSVASVDANGRVTAHKAGKTTIKAEYTSMGISLSASISVTVE